MRPDKKALGKLAGSVKLVSDNPEDYYSTGEVWEVESDAHASGGYVDYVVDAPVASDVVVAMVDEVAAALDYGVRWIRPDRAEILSNTRMGPAVSTLGPVVTHVVVLRAVNAGTRVEVTAPADYRGIRSHYVRSLHLKDFAISLRNRLPGSRARSGGGAPGYYVPGNI